MRFSPAVFERVEQAAGTNGVSVSEFVRQSVLHGSGRLENGDAASRGLLNVEERALFGALLEEVRRVGVNVNQIALRLNTGRAVEAQAISGELSDLREMLGGLAFELRQLSLDPARSSSVNSDG